MSWVRAALQSKGATQPYCLGDSVHLKALGRQASALVAERDRREGQGWGIGQDGRLDQILPLGTSSGKQKLSL